MVIERRRRPEVSKVLFVIAASVLIFAYGVAVGHYHIFPYSILEFARDSLAQVIDDRETIARTRPSKFLFKARGPSSGAERVDESRMAPGPTLVSGFFDRDLEIRLIRADGSIVNRWRPQFHAVFPDPSHIVPKDQIPATNWNTETHGVMAFPDGSILFNFEGKGLVKLDRCGAVEWTVPRMTHHAVSLSSDGMFWIPASRFFESDSRFPTISPPFQEDVILKVAPGGKVVKEISMLDVLFRNHLEAHLFANGPDGSVLAKVDPLHLNAVQELLPSMAPHFPEFAAGDLLVSLRNLNLVMVIDPATEIVKWHRTGPWLDQHDPDFLATGRISVFSNNNDGTRDGSRLGGSMLIELDPVSGESTIRYGASPGQHLFSDKRGNHQQLRNGNILIVESDGGRVIEIDSAGKIVWQFTNRYDQDNVALVDDAIRYDPGYFTVTDWSCSR